MELSIPNDSTPLRGFSRLDGIPRIAAHEAGHILLLWLFGRFPMVAVVLEKGGETRLLDLGEPPFVPLQCLLYAMAGMVCAGDRGLVDELMEHTGEPGYFDVHTDSAFASDTANAMQCPSRSALAIAERLLLRIKRRYAKPLAEIRACFLESAPRHSLGFDRALELFARWDVEYGFTVRPKSDVLARMFARECRISVPRSGWLGWDWKPLKGWEYRLPSARELAERTMEQMKKTTKQV